MTFSDDLRLLGNIQESLITVCLLNKKDNQLADVFNNLVELRDVYVKRTLNNSKMLEYGLLENIKVSIPEKKIPVSRTIVYERNNEYYDK